MPMVIESCGCIEKHYGFSSIKSEETKKEPLKSILNDEYTEKIKEMNMYLRKAHDIYESLPDCIKTLSPETTDGSLSKQIAGSVNLSNRLAWTFNIDVKK